MVFFEKPRLLKIPTNYDIQGSYEHIFETFWKKRQQRDRSVAFQEFCKLHENKMRLKRKLMDVRAINFKFLEFDLVNWYNVAHIWI